jgi:hypothetical protein
MSAWIIQGNQDHFDFVGYINKYDDVVMRTPQSYREMAVADTVYFWRAAGKAKDICGIFAEGEIVNAPSHRENDPRTAEFSSEPLAYTTEWRAGIQMRLRAESTKRVIKIEALVNDPIVGKMGVLVFPNATVFKLTESEARRIGALWENTGRDWSRDQAIAALWAYDKTYGSPISKLPGTPVVEAALRIGRAVNSVYDKLMNFRGIDPRDSRKGFPAGAEIDRQVWAEFYDEKSGSLRREALEQALLKMAPMGSATTAVPIYEDFGAAPPDDPEELQMFARRVRRGQVKLRKKLLQLYEGKCAISGHGPEAVLEAAHIRSHAVTGLNDPSNAILLRADLHTLFDEGLLRIHPDSLMIEIHHSLKSSPYAELAHRHLASRKDGSSPSSSALASRYLASPPSAANPDS